MSTASHRPSFSPHPLAVTAAAFAAGVAFTHYTSVPYGAPLACGLLASSAAGLALFKTRCGAATVAVVLAFACAGAALYAEESQPPEGSRLLALYGSGEVASGDPVEVTGLVERSPEAAPDGLYFTLRSERIVHKGRERVCSGRVELFAQAGGAEARQAYEALELRRGARVNVAARLTRAERYRNPGVETLGDYLQRRGVDVRGSVKSPLLIERLDDERVFLPLHWLDEWRRRALARIDELFDPDAAGVLKAALFGHRRGLAKATAERFREGGTFHVLVVSGMHVSVVGGLVWAAARLLTRRRFIRWVASATAVWGFALAVGAESSAVRAALMLSAASLAPALGRRQGALNALGGAALALLVWKPSNLFDPSFQLTFLAVLAIVALAAPTLARLKEAGDWRPTRATPTPPSCAGWFRTLGEVLFWRERAWRLEQERATHSYRLFKSAWAARLGRLRLQAPLRYAFSAFLVSLVVQITLLPLLVFYFHRLSLAAPLLNVWVGIFVGTACALALAALVSAPLGDLPSTAFACAAEAATRLAAHSVDPFTDARLASLRLPEYTGAAASVYAIYFVPLAALAWALAAWQPVGAPAVGQDGPGETARAVRGKIAVAASALLASLAALIVLHPLSAGRADGRLRIDFLDVGQGDAALVTMPDGTTLLVDGGGHARFGVGGGEDGAFEPDSRGVGDRVVSEFLWHRGLDRVNFLVVTHTDADHIEGLNDVLANFRVGAALVPRAPASDPGFARFLASATRRGVPVYMIARGDVFGFGGATAEVIWPPPPSAPADPSSNNDSAVLRLTLGRRSFLLTGDIEAEAEAALAAHSAGELACDVLKVAHHGSRTSSTETFLREARPALAVVPVGSDSPHGHPHAEALARLRAAGARVLTTGESGAVTVGTDGEDLRVKTYVSAAGGGP